MKASVFSVMVAVYLTCLVDLQLQAQQTTEFASADLISSKAVPREAVSSEPDVDDVPGLFRTATPEATADFQRHVVPLLGRLGCNGRACHGSFQGQGGFRLSLFGYDFSADHTALLDQRVDLQDADESLILYKPTTPDDHEGGLRLDRDSWQYNLILRWIQDGAPKGSAQRLKRLVVSPSAVRFEQSGESVSLKVVAEWANGDREDVTALCRFQSNDPQVAKVDKHGMVSGDQIGDTHVVVFYDQAVEPVSVIRPQARSIAMRPTYEPSTKIDQLVNSRLRELNVVPSDLADDATFLRRVSLDISGTLPNAEEVRQFLDDQSPDKRSRMIDKLLQTPAYAAWWTTFFCDLTGNNTRQLRNAALRQNQASDHWFAWIYERIESNAPYDELARGIVLAATRQEGESYEEYCQRMSDTARGDSRAEAIASETMPYYWMRQDVQDAEARAINFAHTFLGVRIQCAKCHKHPFDQWTQADFQQFSRFFSGVSFSRAAASGADRQDFNRIVKALDMEGKNNNQLRRELPRLLNEGLTVPFPQLVVHAPRSRNNRNRRGRNQPYQTGRLLGGEAIALDQFDDVREPVMQWLASPENPYFAKSLVNRVWAKYFGVGIIEPADDLNLANPPSNEPLMEYLTRGFVESGYDLKWLHREIANSHAYQRSWVPNETNAHDRKNFSHAIPRRLPAELVYDAVVLATAAYDKLLGSRSDLGQRAIAVPGTRLGGNNRQPVSPDFALQIFGRSTRSTSCDCDRSNETSVVQTVYLMNDRDIHFLIGQQEGWIGQLRESQSDLEPQERQRLQQMEARLGRMQRQLREMKDERRRQAMARDIAGLRERIAPLRQRARSGDDSKLPSPESLVAEAYLRTLNRHPTPDELDECLSYIGESASVLDGLQGVLWTLLNTKEFIVNH